MDFRHLPRITHGLRRRNKSVQIRRQDCSLFLLKVWTVLRRLPPLDHLSGKDKAGRLTTPFAIASRKSLQYLNDFRRGSSPVRWFDFLSSLPDVVDVLLQPLQDALGLIGALQGIDRNPSGMQRDQSSVNLEGQ